MKEAVAVELHSINIMKAIYIINRVECFVEEEAWRCELASVSEARDNAQRELEQCKMRITESETALHRYRSVVGEGAADIVEMKVATTEGKASSSEGTTDSNNGWEKVSSGEIVHIFRWRPIRDCNLFLLCLCFEGLFFRICYFWRIYKKVPSHQHFPFCEVDSSDEASGVLSHMRIMYALYPCVNQNTL